MGKPEEAIREGRNPFVSARRNPVTDEAEPLYELKFGLVLYTDYPPGPVRARLVFDLYERWFGQRLRRCHVVDANHSFVVTFDVHPRERVLVHGCVGYTASAQEFEFGCFEETQHSRVVDAPGSIRIHKSYP